MWSEETPDKHCKNGIFYYMDGKLACQQLCEADSGCVGIAWSQSFEIYCYLCHDDILSNACCNYGFYRNPGNGEVHSICLKLFIDFYCCFSYCYYYISQVFNVFFKPATLIDATTVVLVQTLTVKQNVLVQEDSQETHAIQH